MRLTYLSVWIEVTEDNFVFPEKNLVTSQIKVKKRDIRIKKSLVVIDLSLLSYLL